MDDCLPVRTSIKHIISTILPSLYRIFLTCVILSASLHILLFQIFLTIRNANNDNPSLLSINDNWRFQTKKNIVQDVISDFGKVEKC